MQIWQIIESYPPRKMKKKIARAIRHEVKLVQDEMCAGFVYTDRIYF